MFDDLTGRLSGIFDTLTRRGALKEADVDEALREIRVALLEADVASFKAPRRVSLSKISTLLPVYHDGVYMPSAGCPTARKIGAEKPAPGA